MNLHEYQAKTLLTECSIPTPTGFVFDSSDKLAIFLNELPSSEALKKWVIKCQVHAGGRGKSGGVLCSADHEKLIEFSKRWLGNKLVTYQTDSPGQLVNQVLLEEASEIKQELYFSIMVDRALHRIVVIASTEGGVDIEQVSIDAPEKIIKKIIDPLVGPSSYQGRSLAFALNLPKTLSQSFTSFFSNAVNFFIQHDLALLEINPLVITREDKLICLDAKLIVDDNALFRHPELLKLRDDSQEDSREARAHQLGIHYISLSGNIGCMVNGAGLAMATMDIIKQYGAEPANFLDVGGGTTQEKVAEAFKLIVSDPHVKAILVNIFGGIVRCDLIAEGIIAAVKQIGLTLPVIVRLEGNNAALAQDILKQSKLNIVSAGSLSDAAERISTMVK